MNRLRRIRPILFIAGFVFGIAVLVIYALLIESNSADKTGRLLRPTGSNDVLDHPDSNILSVGQVSKFRSDADAEEQRALFMADTYDQYVASRGAENRVAEKPAPPAAPAEVKSAVPATAKTAAKSAPAPKAAPAAKAVNEVDLLARLITAEAQAEPYEAKVAVGAVVMNRVQSGLWANTIKEVIYQKINGYYQFTPVQNGWINKPAEAESIQAAQVALSGTDPTNGAQFYYDDKATNAWILAKPVSVQFGHMIFAF